MPTKTRTLARLLLAIVAVLTTFGAVAAPAAMAKPPHQADGWLGDQDWKAPGSLWNTSRTVGAQRLWQQGVTGAGVHVAVIDTGVAPVAPLADDDKVVAVVDLSLESHVPEARYVDNYGHGTHISGIIAGRSPGTDTLDPQRTDFVGIAPDAGLVSVKVGDNTGAVDVSQVIAAIDWVIEHKDADGLNIRVINLSYGTDASQDYRVDPLSHAVERAWNAGIVVVAAAGNEEYSHGLMANPAINPFVIAVGNFDRSLVYHDAVRHGAERTPDVLAPGGSIESLLVPGSRVATEHPEGVVSDRLLRGTGSSQAAAVISGGVALMLQVRPDLTPDQVKALLMNNQQGNGMVNLDRATWAAVPADYVQTWEPSTGLGSLEEARGTHHVIVNGVEIIGEVTVWGDVYDPYLHTELAAQGASWSGASWSGASWSGASWSGASWSGASWSGASWSGASWSGASWSGASWSGASWTGAVWT